MSPTKLTKFGQVRSQTSSFTGSLQSKSVTRSSIQCTENITLECAPAGIGAQRRIRQPSAEECSQILDGRPSCCMDEAFQTQVASGSSTHYCTYYSYGKCTTSQLGRLQRRIRQTLQIGLQEWRYTTKMVSKKEWRRQQWNLSSWCFDCIRLWRDREMTRR
jgi:hypothetical protein